MDGGSGKVSLCFETKNNFLPLMEFNNDLLGFEIDLCSFKFKFYQIFILIKNF